MGGSRLDDQSTDSSDTEDLPSCAFLNPRPNQSDLGRAKQTDVTAPLPHASRPEPRGKPRDVVMISSGSDEEEITVPLAIRLKQRLGGSTSSVPAVTQPLQASVCQPGSSVLRHQAKADSGSASQRHAPFPLPLCSEEFGKAPDFTRIAVGSSAPGSLEEPRALTNIGGSSSAGGAAKRSATEIRASREDALKRREAREKNQAVRGLRKLELERQRAEKKAFADAIKALRPEECIKHMVVCVDPALLQLEGGGTLLTSLQALGCSCAIERQALPRSITWARRAPESQIDEARCVPESHVVIHVPLSDFITMVSNYSQEQRGDIFDNSQTLTGWTSSLLAESAGRMPSLAVVGIEDYFRSQKAQSQRKYRKAVLGNEAVAAPGKARKRKEAGEKLPEISRVVLEEALVDLQLHTGVQVHFLASWKDFSDYIAMSTKAVAEAPFKREREQTGFSFCLESEWAGGQRVDRDGKGLLQVWRRQIQQLNRVSPDIANAILAAYPSPQLLAQAYARCCSEREKLSLLSDLLIRRGEGVTSTTRRVGPELSKRLFLLMTSSNPHQTLDSKS
ncbi:crossover junction endonuclease EME1 [Brienomyrus brachyistius]|uniref:crossover junction endonuclease EME1 n=1 Tax=Brienomyrus brachyistius TaxID=42636 RepID=UPI0020B3DCA2|nr:crossover junction endonuclease EME1 [Brienomyrus brachyistius]XP_048871263.1 crossover junction endonuclease EME1 [Brienomyrus brachyistius]XP_048871264.1 crossover junction endonuclease EME1 [Brienomyrus brachyistius]XP_048871265.1 crossover junction endonuclease EME1 [Brienomyrus brachyistius]XP_048871266.1 crossover junction endonuclease EME1 [Brienomyrus brachyistius]